MLQPAKDVVTTAGSAIDDTLLQPAKDVVTTAGSAIDDAVIQPLVEAGAAVDDAVLQPTIDVIETAGSAIDDAVIQPLVDAGAAFDDAVIEPIVEAGAAVDDAVIQPVIEAVKTVGSAVDDYGLQPVKDLFGNLPWSEILKLLAGANLAGAGAGGSARIVTEEAAPLFKLDKEEELAEAEDLGSYLASIGAEENKTVKAATGGMIESSYGSLFDTIHSSNKAPTDTLNELLRIVGDK